MSGSEDASETDELAEIRRRKRERLAERLGESDGAGAAGESGSGDGGPATTPSEPVHVSGPDHLSSFVAEHDVVLVDFYADWCGPCKTLEPVVADLARETEAAVAKVDIDAHQDVASGFGVRSVPTLVLFAGGDPVERVVGVRGRGELEGLVGQYT